MTAIYEKELRSYFSSMTGWVFISALLLLSGVMTAAVNLSGALSAFENTLYTVSYVFLFTVPILTMGVGADERKNKTDILLRSLPLSPMDVVMGKYLALLTVFAVPCTVMCAYPAVLSTYGAVNFPSAYGALFGFFLLGACLLAFGMVVSFSLDSPVIAGVVTFFSLLFTYLLGSVSDLLPDSAFASLAAFILLTLALCALVFYLLKSVALSVSLFVGISGIICLTYKLNTAAFEGAFGAFLEWLCIYDRFTVFLTGMFDLSGIVYFLTITAVCLVFAVQIRYGRGRR
ncbi:MAG: ABC-2 transporter permease [Clostridia bacterium]|nr:ABC-2 transporter permease [Clostridia bacterium]